MEPDYALAYSGMASCYLNLWIFNYWAPENCLPNMMAAAKRCLELDNKIAESHIAVARVKMFYDWDFKAAEVYFRIALELNSNTAEIHEQYAYCLSFLGRSDEALAHAATALSLEPFSLVTNNHAGITYWMTKAYDKGLEQGTRLIKLEPNFYGGYHLRGLMFSYMRRYEEAIEACEFAAVRNYSSHTLSLLGKTLGVMGEKEKALEVIKKMEELKTTQAVGNFDMGIVYAGMKDFKTALEYFEYRH